jgi:hypothetical protein
MAEDGRDGNGPSIRRPAVGGAARSGDLRRTRQLRRTRRVPELWQVVVECRDEAEQREVFERLKAEGRKVRVHVL